MCFEASSASSSAFEGVTICFSFVSREKEAEGKKVGEALSRASPRFASFRFARLLYKRKTLAPALSLPRPPLGGPEAASPPLRESRRRRAQGGSLSLLSRGFFSVLLRKDDERSASERPRKTRRATGESNPPRESPRARFPDPPPAPEERSSVALRLCSCFGKRRTRAHLEFVDGEKKNRWKAAEEEQEVFCDEPTKQKNKKKGKRKNSISFYFLQPSLPPLPLLPLPPSPPPLTTRPSARPAARSPSVPGKPPRKQQRQERLPPACSRPGRPWRRP